MARIEHYDKRVGITYVYESESYYDSEKHQSRSKRKLIGKIDPETGKMVPTGKKGRPSKNITSNGDIDYEKQCKTLQNQLENAEEKIKNLETELKAATASINDYHKILKKISSLCEAEK